MWQMPTSITALPAYGRDYKSQAAVKADWLAKKDFRDALTGSYLNIDTANKLNLTVYVRYQKTMKIVRVR